MIIHKADPTRTEIMSLCMPADCISPYQNASILKVLNWLPVICTFGHFEYRYHDIILMCLDQNRPESAVSAVFHGCLEHRYTNLLNPVLFSFILVDSCETTHGPRSKSLKFAEPVTGQEGGPMTRPGV